MLNAEHAELVALRDEGVIDDTSCKVSNATSIWRPHVSTSGRVHVPATEEPISFEQHVKPLFRERDRQSMKWAFDLGAHDDVARNSEAILQRLRDGTMPCDGAWPEEQIALFQDWIEAGKPA